MTHGCEYRKFVSYRLTGTLSSSDDALNPDWDNAIIVDNNIDRVLQV